MPRLPRVVLRRLLPWLVALWAASLAAQSVDIIELRHKTVDQVLPALQPLLEAGGTLSGMNNQLFLRASPRNRADIRRALAAIDTPSRRLIIHVSQHAGRMQSEQGAAANADIVLGSTRRSSAQASVWETRSQRAEGAGQMVQTIEGAPAFIQVGQRLVVPMRQMLIGPGGTVIHETPIIQDVSRGFYALARVHGERVSLELSQQADSLAGPALGQVNTQRLTTTLSGRLGEWIAVGGSDRQATGKQRGTLSLSSGEARDSRTLWLMVEEVD
jgi:hypothetical protein